MEMVDFAPGMRTIIRDEEWMIKKIETNNLGNKTLYCVGISPLVKDREASFLTDLEQIQVVNPAEVKLVADYSPFYKRALLYLESQWRQQIPTDFNLHIGHRAAMDLMPYQLDQMCIRDRQVPGSPITGASSLLNSKPALSLTQLRMGWSFHKY